MKLDEFTRAYLECALWSTTDGDEPLDANYTVDDIAPETLASMVQDCESFQAEHAEDLSCREARAGQDFWLTRNGHGAGFWDGDWPEDVGERLTDASHACGSVDLYVADDGLIHHA
jgi:hypothetical protein